MVHSRCLLQFALGGLPSGLRLRSAAGGSTLPQLTQACLAAPPCAQMDLFCLQHGKRCVMWDDEGAGFYLVRPSCLGWGRSEAAVGAQRPCNLPGWGGCRPPEA